MTPRTPRPALRSHPLPSLAATLALGSIALGATHCRPPLCLAPASDPGAPQTLRDEVLAPFRCALPAHPRPPTETSVAMGGAIATVTTEPTTPPPPPDPVPRVRPPGGLSAVRPTPPPPPPPVHTMPARGGGAPVQPMPARGARAAVNPTPPPAPAVSVGQRRAVTPAPVERSR